MFMILIFKSQDLNPNLKRHASIMELKPELKYSIETKESFSRKNLLGKSSKQTFA